MRPYTLIVFLIMLLVTPACSLITSNKDHPISTHSLTNMDESMYDGKAGEPHRTNSFFVYAERIENGKLLLERGIAVSVFSDKRQSVLLTSSHLVNKAQKIYVRPWSSNPCRAMDSSSDIEAQIIDESPENDAALLMINIGGFDIAQPVTNDQKVGTSIVMFGQPGKPFYGAMSRGIISGFWLMEDLGVLMISDAVTTPGYSGSGVFIEGEPDQLVGIVHGKTRDENRGFAYIIPVFRLLNFINLIPEKLKTISAERCDALKSLKMESTPNNFLRRNNDKLEVDKSSPSIIRTVELF